MPFKDLSENEILKKIKELLKKDDFYTDVIRQYFQEIYQRYYFQCYNISRYYGLSRPDAEDAAQESFIRLLRNAKSYDCERPFKPWFFKVVLNTVKDKYRELKKHRYTNIDSLINESSEEQENIFEEFHMRHLFLSIISRLPTRFKSVVLLRNYTDMNLDAISTSVGLSVRQVHNRLNIAYKRIREEMEEKK